MVLQRVRHHRVTNTLTFNKVIHKRKYWLRLITCQRKYNQWYQSLVSNSSLSLRQAVSLTIWQMRGMNLWNSGPTTRWPSPESRQVSDFPLLAAHPHLPGLQKHLTVRPRTWSLGPFIFPKGSRHFYRSCWSHIPKSKVFITEAPASSSFSQPLSWATTTPGRK